MTSARLEAATQSTPEDKLREVVFDLSVQMQIEGYEKREPTRPVSIREGKSS